MSSLDILSMAVRNLLKRKMRTVLTVLGVVVGCAAIVIMISLGLGINRSFEKQMENMGDITKIDVYNYDGYYGWTKDALVIDKDFIAQVEEINGVKAVSPYAYTYLTAVSGRYRADLQIYGLNPATMADFGYVAKDGRLLEEGDMQQIVFGSEVPFSFTNPRDRGGGGGMYGGVVRSMGGGMIMVDVGMVDKNGAMVEEEMPNVNVVEDRIEASYVMGFGDPDYEPDPETQGKTIKPYKLDGIGVLERSETLWETQYNCFMNIEMVEKIIAERQKYEKSLYGGGNSQETYGYERIMIKVTDVKVVDKVIDALVELGIDPNNIMNPRTMVKSMQDMMGSLQALLGAIGAVSLFVAAIGIANTMIMSIYERTREIGVMKVIGASIRDIKWLFLTEAAAIGILGGVFGVGLSLFVSFIINDTGISFFDMFVESGMDISYIPMWLCGAALAFSAAIGLLSGYFPARRAMRLSALSAIRSE